MMIKVTEFKLWLEIEIGEKAEPANRPTENFCNVVVNCEDGRRYALNVWTYDFLPIARRESLAGTLLVDPSKYVLPPDLFVERLERKLIEEVFRQLFANDEMKDEWLSPE